MRLFTGFSVLSMAVALVACAKESPRVETAHTDSLGAARADSIARERQDSINRAQPGYIIDSLLPVEEEIRRFKAAIGGTPVTELSGGAPSRDSLYKLFVRAVERRDTASLVRALITTREFIDLYYPESPHTHPPYRQPPGLLWSTMELPSSKGLRRLLERRAGEPLHATGLRCETKPEQQGNNRLWGRCTVGIREPGGAERQERLFGSIIERQGIFKFMSYANAY